MEFQTCFRFYRFRKISTPHLACCASPGAFPNTLPPQDLRRVELGRVGFWLEQDPFVRRQQGLEKEDSSRGIQHKTGLYNTPKEQNQTHERGVRKSLRASPK